MVVPIFFWQFFPKRLVQIQNGQKWPFQLFSDNFSQNEWHKFGMAKNGCSNIFRQFFSQKDWYKLGMAKNDHFPIFSNNFSQKDWYKFSNGQKWLFQFFSNNFSQKNWYKFGMAKNACSNLFLTIFPKRTGINLEWKKWPFHIIFQQFFSRRLV